MSDGWLGSSQASKYLFQILMLGSKKVQSTNCLGQFSQRIRSEQLAIASEIKKYKLNYQTKVIQRSALDNFVRFAKQLHLLILSYCKNIIYVAPQNLTLAIDELTLLFDDLLKKFQDVLRMYHQKLGEQGPPEPKGHSLSELCAVCSQQIKKINVDKVRSCIMNEIDLKGLQKFQDSDSSKEDEDALFFQEVNKLLTMKQGELLKNQVEINNYKEIALNALGYLTALKDHFGRESIIMPSSGWMVSAKEQMQMVLRQSFQGKIPGWISKMLSAFCSHYQRQIERRRCEVGTQTDSHVQLQMIELRKKVAMAKQKLQMQQNLVRIQQRELGVLKGEKGNLQGKIDYYKKELNKLIEEIENAKMENQILKMKLTNSRFNQLFQKNQTERGSNNDSAHDLSREYILDSRRTHKMRTKGNDSDQRMLPKINEKSHSKRSEQHIRTSIKVNLSSQSNSRLEAKKSTRKIEKLSDANISTSAKNEEISLSLNDTLQNIAANEREWKGNEREWKAKKNSNLLSDFSTPKTVIKEEFGELSVEDYKLKIREVDQHLKTAIKQAIFLKNGQKHFSSSVFQQNELKRVPRRTVKPQEIQISKDEHRKIQGSLKKNHNLLRLSKIYNYLKDSGYLIKISEQEFKESILKIRLFQDPQINQSNLSDTKRLFKSKKYLFQKDCLLKRSLYQQSSCDNKINPLELSYHNFASNYIMLFISVQNAYVYEISMTKNHYSGTGKLDPSEQLLCQQLYDLINHLKAENLQQYKIMCSFIRFPYQVMTSSLGSISIGNDMKYNTFEIYFGRILGIHQKCKKQEGICQHFKEFRVKLSEQCETNRQPK